MPRLSKRLRSDVLAAVSAVLIILIGVLLVSASSVVILLYEGSQEVESPDLGTASWGDTVRVDYTGKLTDGRVFDTSLWEVANNDALYPKSLSFSLKNQSAYKPLEFQLGAGKMIPGFERGVVGMIAGDTKVIEIPPEDGYGQLNRSKLRTIPLVAEERVFDTLNISAFEDKYGSSPVVDKTLKDPFYGWDMTVLSVDEKADSVLIQNSPVRGERYPVFGAELGLPNTGWYITIDSVDSTADSGRGVIVVRHLVEADDAGYLKGIDESGAEFILHEVREDSNQVVLNYNGELVGKTLFFTVTLVEIVESD